jgi:hypothetical protein
MGILFNTLFAFARYIFVDFVNLFPVADPTIVSNISSMFTAINTGLAGINFIFPLPTFLLDLQLVIALEVLLFTIRFIYWIGKIVTLGFLK